MLIAQITDTHIMAPGRLAFGKVDSAAALERCVAHVNSLDPRPDVALVTGDLVDSGSADEYAVLRAVLTPLAMPFLLIPGNHDDRAQMRAAFPGHAYLDDGGEFAHYVIEDYPLRLVGLDTVVEGQPYGEMCERRLVWLDERLAQAPERPTLVFMHHPPFLTGIDAMDGMNCRNGEAFARVLARHPQVVRVLCGHVHRAIQLQWRGISMSIGPSPSHAVALELRPRGPLALVMEPPACHLHYWRPETGLITHLTYVGQRAQAALWPLE